MLQYLDVGGTRLHDVVTTPTRGVSKVDGLLGLSGVRGTPYDRPEADGSVEPFAQFLPARGISVEGLCLGATIDAAWANFRVVCQALEASLSTDTTMKFQSTNGALQLQCTVRLAGPVQSVLDVAKQGPVLFYQAQFRASDPRHYSQTLQSASTVAPSATGGFALPIPFPIPFGAGATGGSVTVTNGGNTTSWPLITLVGPCNGPVITVGASTLYLSTLNIAAGSTLTIDTNPTTRSVTVAGANVLSSLDFTQSIFGGLAPGAGTNIAFYAAGGGTTTSTLLTVAWRDAYTS